jgi:hypothetical protein
MHDDVVSNSQASSLPLYMNVVIDELVDRCLRNGDGESRQK